MKILNLYAGIGGNRKLWGDDHEITAIEIEPNIAKIYQDFFPKDKVIVCDAHQYLLEHYKEFDFIWSSPPCPTHSKIRNQAGVGTGQVKPVYPEMKLYEEIIFLQYNYDGKFVVENVVSYYKPLIKPQEIARHYFWTNFYITPYSVKTRGHYLGVKGLKQLKGFEINGKGLARSGETVLRNCVEPETGLHIFQEAFREHQTLL